MFIAEIIGPNPDIRMFEYQGWGVNLRLFWHKDGHWTWWEHPGWKRVDRENPARLT